LAIAEHELFPAAAKLDYAAFEKRQELVQERRREQWAESKEAAVRKLIEKARQQKPRPRDLPDKVSARKGTKDWYLRVSVNYDRRGTKQATRIVRLREGETDAELFQRVRAATTEALFRDADREKREREKDFPDWAKAKKRAVEQALAEQRRREKGGENLPDGMVLVAERQVAGPPPGEDAPESPRTVEVTRTSSEGARRTGAIGSAGLDPGHGQGLARGLSASGRSEAHRNLRGPDQVAGADRQVVVEMRLALRGGVQSLAAQTIDARRAW
jgi:hypothetical protein